MNLFQMIDIQWFATITTGNLTGLVETAYSKAVEFAFQPRLHFAQFAEHKTWDINERDPMPGDAVTFTIFSNMTVATGALSESGDPTPATMAKTAKTVTLYEYGNLITSTRKLRVLSFANIDTSAAKMVGDNMGKSMDLVARAAFDSNTGSSYIRYASGAANATGVVATMTLTAEEVRRARNKLERADVMKPDGMFYTAIIHPDTAYDLQAETGAGSWRAPKEYTDPENIYNGEIGAFEGFRFISTSQAAISTDGGSGTVDLYTNYFLGWQSCAYAEGIAPQIGFSGPFDAMQRLMNVYWYGLVGFGELRPESLFKVYSASSVGTNT